MPSKLFKYLPEAFVNSFLDGNVIFRNLVYFKRVEADPRNDIFEGKHIDAPDHNVELTVVSTGRRISGRFAYHNALKDMEKVFCFCVSLKLSAELQQRFGGACIEITEPLQFKDCLERSLIRRNRLSRLARPILLSEPVKYYKVNEAAPPEVDVKNPLHLPFLKRAQYADEAEFRFVFARRGGFELKQMIVNTLFDERDEIARSEDRELIVKVGSIRDIARQVEGL